MNLPFKYDVMYFVEWESTVPSGHQYSALRTMQSITFKPPLTELWSAIKIFAGCSRPATYDVITSIFHGHFRSALNYGSCWILMPLRDMISSVGWEDLVSQKYQMFRRAKKRGYLNTLMNGTASFLPWHSGSIFSDWNLQFGQDKS